MLATGVQAYFLWRQHAHAADSDTIQKSQAEALEAQRRELELTRQVAEAAAQATRTATLRVMDLKRASPPPQAQPGIPGLATTKMRCVVRNLGPAVVNDVKLEQLHVSGASYGAPFLSESTVSSLGVGEDFTFVIDTQVSLPAVAAPFGLGATVTYRDETGFRRVKLTYP